jgi:hypothetical protein
VRIGLVSCGRSKLTTPAPAQELYTGGLFRQASEYAERTYDRWLILSARYGAIDPDEPIEPYELTLKSYDPTQRYAWARRVIRQLDAFNLPTGAQLWVHAGKEYRVPLIEAGLELHLPPGLYLPDMRIGKQKHWYKERELAH